MGNPAEETYRHPNQNRGASIGRSLGDVNDSYGENPEFFRPSIYEPQTLFGTAGGVETVGSAWSRRLRRSRKLFITTTTVLPS